jgi:ring-1,2-phenylacetyl-CoA epoxidase subunit PaaC
MTTQAPVVAPPTPAVAGLLLAMADDEFVLGFSDSEWTGIAPLLEEDVAMSSLAQDELGHAAALYDLLAAVAGGDHDALAYDREPADYRHARLLDHARGDWAMTIARRWLYETADAVRLDALADGSWAPLADLVGKIRREERYHAMHVGAWLERLAHTEGEPRERLVAALTALGPDAGTVFSPLPDEATLVASGILHAPMVDLEARWRAVIAPVLARLDLPAPPPTRDPEHGRTSHGEAFRWLHGAFTSVRRSDPGATW